MSIKIDISVGELIDKLTILQIKSEKMTDKTQLNNIEKEKNILEAQWKSSPYKEVDIDSKRQELLQINLSLWEIEDSIRDKEKAGEFDDVFIELARSVYITNDKRAKVKKEINQMTNSSLVEEKSYSDYQRK